MGSYSNEQGFCLYFKIVERGLHYKLLYINPLWKFSKCWEVVQVLPWWTTFVPMDDLLKVDEPEFIINIHFICLFIFFKYKFYCVLLYLTIYDMIRYMIQKKKKKRLTIRFMFWHIWVRSSHYHNYWMFMHVNTWYVHFKNLKRKYMTG